MTTRPICFIDTETTCLGPHARPWEIAVIRRDPDGGQTEHLAQVAYRLQTLPAHTDPKALHLAGWLFRGADGQYDYLESLNIAEARRYDTEEDAARWLSRLLADEPILVGVGVHFDAAVLGAMFIRHGLEPEPWHYGILDLKAATWGALSDRAQVVPLPLRSETLAAELDVVPPASEERHTALGDARWAARWFDALAGEHR